MDLSKLSDADLEALQKGDLSKVSDEGLTLLQSTPAAETGAGAVVPTEEPGMGAMAVGGLKTAYDVVAPIVKEHPLATTLAASYIPGLNRLPILNDIKTSREAAANIIKRGTNIASNMMANAGTTPGVITPVSPANINPNSTTAQKINIINANTPPVTSAVAPTNMPATMPSNVTQLPVTQTPGTVNAQQGINNMIRGAGAAPVAQETGGILSRVAPYLQTAGKIAAPIARIAGPVGMGLTAAEAYPYIQQANIGARTASGEVGQNINKANMMALSMPTAAPLSAQEAKNLLASGDERTINIYGGRARLQSIISAPNAVNSGYTQQLNNLSR